MTPTLKFNLDIEPYTLMWNGQAISDAELESIDYLQEAAVPMPAGGETHGGGDVFLGAIGLGADNFSGVLTNHEVFGLIKKSLGL